MPGTSNDLHGVLDGYSKFLQEKDLTPAAHHPCLVRWVREFLLFAETHRGYDFEQTLDLFLAEVGTRVGVKPWQLQQAAKQGPRRRVDREGWRTPTQVGCLRLPAEVAHAVARWETRCR